MKVCRCCGCSICFFTFLLLKNSITSAAACSDAEVEQLKSCYIDYFENLSVDSYNLMSYEKVVSNHKETWPGVETLCSNFTLLQSCLNNSIETNCVNEKGFDKTGWSNGKFSRGFTADYFVLDFTCGDGYNEYEESYDCLKHATTSCSKIESNCEDLRDFIICYSKDAKDQCGDDGYYYTYNEMTLQYCYLITECSVCGSVKNSFSLVLGLLSLLIYLFIRSK